MITLITGAPGAGKTALMVELLRTIYKDRPVYACNVEGLTLPHFQLDDLSKWPEVVPDGSLVVCDEVQRFWRPRGPGQKVPADVSALETHIPVISETVDGLVAIGCQGGLVARLAR